MKIIIILILSIFATIGSAKTIEEKLTVNLLKLNTDKGLYEVSFNEMAAIYKADKKILQCLQKSLEKKEKAKINFEPRGLKITSCEN